MSESLHRWSGWPGAWCLDCGVPDPQEEALAGNQVEVPAICGEPHSHRHDPYWERLHNPEICGCSAKEEE